MSEIKIIESEELVGIKIGEYHKYANEKFVLFSDHETWKLLAKKQLKEAFENYEDETAFNLWQIRKSNIPKIIDEVFEK